MKIASSVPGLSLAGLMITSPTASARQWTKLQGRTIEAEMARADGYHVTLIINGKEVRYALDQLCQEDRQHVADWVEQVANKQPQHNKNCTPTTHAGAPRRR